MDPVHPESKKQIPVLIGAVILGIVAVFLFLQGYKLDISQYFAAEPIPSASPTAEVTPLK